VYRIHSIKLLPVLRFAAFSVAFIASMPTQAQVILGKANEIVQQDDSESGRKIRKITDLSLKAREPSFREQAKSLARGYRETAELVARQGGDPKPILNAAAYFERQVEVTSKVGMGQ
jgi:hypothetical protein